MAAACHNRTKPQRGGTASLVLAGFMAHAQGTLTASYSAQAFPLVHAHQAAPLLYLKPINGRSVPQIFCSCKEMLTLYQAGLKLPDDVENVLRGFSQGQTTHKVAASGPATGRLYLLDAGLVVNQLQIQ